MVKSFGSFTLRGAFVALVAAGGVNAACGKLVGIDDTEVGSGGAGGAASGAGGKSGAAGASTTGGSGGSAGKGVADGGRSAGGSSGSGATGGSSAGAGGGSGTGGAVGGSSGTGGKGGSAGAPSGGKGGGSGTGGDAGGSMAGSGEGGMPGTECTSGDKQCAKGVRQSCQTDGTWADDPCPLDKPTCDAGACIVRGPTMVKVTSYYIDSTEVTVAQYNEFLTAKNGDTSGQPAVCSGWNLTYDPSSLPGKVDFPVRYIDWCDAAAYCKWADKHLCAGIGGDTLHTSDLFDGTISQWYLACGNDTPYINSDPVCNTQDGFEDVAAVASFPQCEGYLSGLFDMVGNVAEWVDVCDSETGDTDVCYLLGGSVQDSKSWCDVKYDGYTRSSTAYDFGFRCCSG